MAKVANIEKTSKKRPAKPFKGDEGKQFTSDNQPSPEAKSKGWQELRKQKLLTQNILKILLDSEGIPTKEGEDYFKSLLINAKEGNSKAIDTINNAIEDQVTKIENTHTFPDAIEL